MSRWVEFLDMDTHCNLGFLAKDLRAVYPDGPGPDDDEKGICNIVLAGVDRPFKIAATCDEIKRIMLNRAW